MSAATQRVIGLIAKPADGLAGAIADQNGVGIKVLGSCLSRKNGAVATVSSVRSNAMLVDVDYCFH
jgi:hypothetical protein